MIQTGYIGGSGLGMFGWPMVPDIVKAAPSNGKPPADGEATEFQPRPLGNAYTSLWTNSTSAIGCGNLLNVHPWLHWPGTYATYRTMRGHPTIALARAMLFSSILAGQRGVEADEKAPPEWTDLVRTAIVPLVDKYVADALFAVDYGWQPFEIVWKSEGGFLVPAKFKPLLVDLSQALIDPAGQPVGVRNANIDLLRFKGWIVNHDQEADDPYGRSRLENVRKDWARSELLDDEAMRTAKKIAGVIAIIRHPPGGYKDAANNNKYISYQANAATALRALSTGVGITLETLGFEPDDLRNNPDLAKVSLTDVDFYDAGAISTSLSGFSDRQRYYDSRMFRGMYRPERSGMEGQMGTKAEAEAHGDIGLKDSEQLHSRIINTLNKGPLDDMLELNFGAAARGKVFLKAAPLVDPTAGADNLLLQAIYANPALFEQLIVQIDVDAVVERRGLPKGDNEIVMTEITVDNQGMTTQDKAAQAAKDKTAADAQ